MQNSKYILKKSVELRYGTKATGWECVCVCACVCACVHVCAHVCARVHMYVCMCACVCICVCACVCMCMCVCVHVLVALACPWVQTVVWGFLGCVLAACRIVSRMHLQTLVWLPRIKPFQLYTPDGTNSEGLTRLLGQGSHRSARVSPRLSGGSDSEMAETLFFKRGFGWSP